MYYFMADISNKVHQSIPSTELEDISWWPTKNSEAKCKIDFGSAPVWSSLLER